MISSYLRQARLLFVLCGAIGVHAVLADSTWKGERFDLNADWSSAANWDGGVPMGSATATIGYASGNSSNFHVLGLTPPADFTGTINLTYDTTDWDTCFHNTLKLTVLDGAAWTVSGNGMLYASAALSSRIGSSFTGVIVVTNGASFTVSSSLADAVEFVGDGRLLVSELKRLSHVSGFTGTLVWMGDAALSPTDTTSLQLRKIELANGATLSYGENYLSANAAIKIKDWNEAPEDWSFGGTSGSHGELEFDTRLAHANADGSLALVTDPKQIHSAVYTGRKLKIHDNWGVSFRYAPDLPDDSAVGRAGWASVWSGSFGFFMVPNDAPSGITYDMPLSKVAHGFKFHLYKEDSNVPYLGWFRGAEIDTYKRVSQTQLNLSGGPDMCQPMDISMTCQNGLLSVVMRQDGRYFAFTRNAAKGTYLMRDIPNGFYLAFGGASGWWDSSDTSHRVPWSKQTISNFRGWYRAREAGRWVEDSRSFYPFTTANCTARRYTVASTYTSGSDALESDGSFKVESNGERLETIIRSSLALDRRKRQLVSYDLVYGDGTSAENTERFKFGFTRANDALGSWLYRWDASNNGIASEFWNGAVYPFQITLKWYDGIAKFFTTKPTKSDGTGSSYSSSNFSYPKMLKNQTAHTSLVYDGVSGLYYQVQSAQHVTDVSWLCADATYGTAGFGDGNNMYFIMSSQNTWGQVDAWLKNLTVKTLTDNQEVYLSGGVSVASGASASFKADALKADSDYPAATLGGVTLAAGSTLQTLGGKVEIETVLVSGSGATLSATAETTVLGGFAYVGDVPEKGLTLSGPISLAGKTAIFVVPDAWRSYKEWISFLKMPEGALPESVRFVTESGRDLTARADVRIGDGEVCANFSKGLAIIIR